MTPLASRLLCVVAIETLIGALSFVGFDDRVLAWQAAARYSGRLSLLIFAAIVIADALPNSAASRLLSSRPYHLFAVAHVVHLCYLLTYLILADRFPNPVRLAGGALGYAMIVAMPFLHARQLLQTITDKTWRRLRAGYLSYIGIVMLVTYIARLRPAPDAVFGGDRSHYIALFAFTIALGLWRMVIAVRAGGLALP